MTTRREFLGAMAGAAVGSWLRPEERTVGVGYAFTSESGDSAKPPFVCVFSGSRCGRVHINAPEYQFFRHRMYRHVPKRAGAFVGLRIRESSVKWHDGGAA